MNIESMDRLTTAIVNCFMLNKGFSLPAEGVWQTRPFIPHTALFNVEVPDFLKPDGLYLYWKVMQRRGSHNDS